MGAAAAAPVGVETGDLGELLMCGFSGTSPTSPSAQWLAQQIRAGRVAGALFVKENIGSVGDVVGLTQLFSRGAPRRPILAIDHEGGAVQRLVRRHGLERLPSAKRVAATRTVDEARALYARAGSGMARLGFNLNLAPDVDLDEPRNPAIGGFGRSFSDDPQVVAAYARAFIDGFAAAGVRSVLKHFPGAGGALEDPHMGLPGMATSWSPRDLEPFRALIADGRVPAVMTGFSAYETGREGLQAAALSRAVVTGLLRDDMGFEGLALTDDLDMGATGGGRHRRAVVRGAIRAGNDLLMIRNVHPHDPDLPGKLASWVEASLAAGEVSAADLRRAVERVRAFRGQEAG